MNCATLSLNITQEIRIMNELTFCPKCGHQTLQWDGSNKWSCSHCNFVLYHNCAAAVAVVIKWKDEIFLTRRNQEPGKGKLDLAGGFSEPHESAEETCCRELHEELGITIEQSRLRILATQPNVYHYGEIDYNTMDIFFEYEVEEKFSVQLEVEEVSAGIWFPVSDIPVEEIAFSSQQTFFRNYLGLLD